MRKRAGVKENCPRSLGLSRSRLLDASSFPFQTRAFSFPFQPPPTPLEA